MVLWPLWVLNKTRCRFVLRDTFPMVVSCVYRSPRNGPGDWKGLLGQKCAERELGHPAQSPRFAAAPRRAEVGTACDRVARIRCHSIAPEEIDEILRVLLVREDSAEPRL